MLLFQCFPITYIPIFFLEHKVLWLFFNWWKEQAYPPEPNNEPYLLLNLYPSRLCFWREGIYPKLNQDTIVYFRVTEMCFQKDIRLCESGIMTQRMHFFAFLRRRETPPVKLRYRYRHGTTRSIFLWSLSNFKWASRSKWTLFDLLWSLNILKIG